MPPCRACISGKMGENGQEIGVTEILSRRCACGPLKVCRMLVNEEQSRRIHFLVAWGAADLYTLDCSALPFIVPKLARASLIGREA